MLVAPINVLHWIFANFGNLLKIPVANDWSFTVSNKMSTISAPCTAGYFRDSGCKKCPKNTYSGSGAKFCTKCPKDKIAPAGSVSVDKCKFGKFWKLLKYWL